MTSNNNRKLTLKKNDECYTPDVVWDNISCYLPSQDSIVYEPFYGQGHTFRYLQNKYSTVLGKEDLDFFSNESSELLNRCDYVISNPPFSLKFKIVKRLVEYNKPFILLFPLGSINTSAFLSAFDNEIENVSIIIPNGRIKYIVNGSVQNSPSFESCYLCYKMRIDKLIFLK